MTVRFCVPHLGAKVKLTVPWRFSLTPEYRNMGLVDALHGALSCVGVSDPPSTMNIEMQPGATLTVERVFIRKGASGFDSMTFRLALPPIGEDPVVANVWCTTDDGKLKWVQAELEQFKKAKTVRFWTALGYCNGIEGNLV